MTEMLVPVLAAAAIAATLLVWGLSAARGWRARGRATGSLEASVEAGPLVSILVPAWNEEAVLARCVRAVQTLRYPRWECVLVAGGSDRTFEVATALAAADPRIAAVRQEPAGKNAALNQGLAAARGELVATLDADCVVEPAWLSQLASAIGGGADACFGTYQPEPLTWVSRQFVIDRVVAYVVRGSTTLHGGGILLRRSAIDAIGGRFPDAVVVGTDWDLDRRVARAGLRKAFVPGARHSTPYPATLREFVRNELRWRRAHLIAALRFGDWRPRGRAGGLRDLMPYWLPWATLLGIIAAAFAFKPFPRAAWVVLIVLGLTHGWLLARRTGQVFEVAASSGDWRWLRFIWLPAVTMVVMLAAGGAAVLSFGRASPHFQGPRPGRT